MNPIHRSHLATFALAILAFCAGTAKCADLNPAAQKLEGTWLVTVTRLNPPPNVPPTFQSLMAVRRQLLRPPNDNYSSRLTTSTPDAAQSAAAAEGDSPPAAVVFVFR